MGRSVGRSRDYQIFWDGYITLAMGLRPRARFARARSSAKNILEIYFVDIIGLCK